MQGAMQGAIRGNLFVVTQPTRGGGGPSSRSSAHARAPEQRRDARAPQKYDGRIATVEGSRSRRQEGHQREHRGDVALPTGLRVGSETDCAALVIAVEQGEPHALAERCESRATRSGAGLSRQSREKP